MTAQRGTTAATSLTVLPGSGPWAPLCMEPADWGHWQAMNPRNASGGSVDRPCADCPLSFAAEMRSKGKCNGTPAGVADEGGTVLTAHLSVVNPPCETCVHAPVCRIREQVMELRKFSLVAPDDGIELDPGLTVVATATVECRYYQRARGGVRGDAREAKLERRATRGRLGADDGQARRNGRGASPEGGLRAA